MGTRSELLKDQISVVAFVAMINLLGRFLSINTTGYKNHLLYVTFTFRGTDEEILTTKQLVAGVKDKWN